MRHLGWFVVVLAGCPAPGDSQIPPDAAAGCVADTECGGLVCARTGECLAPSDVRTVRVTWTVQGKPANNATCASSPDLEIEFYDLNDYAHGYAPVPCVAGVYTIDKLPTRFYRVRMALIDTDGGGRANIDATGNATLDLPY